MFVIVRSGFGRNEEHYVKEANEVPNNVQYVDIVAEFETREEAEAALEEMI